VINVQLIIKELKGIKNILYAGLAIILAYPVLGFILGSKSESFKYLYSVHPFIIMILILTVGILIVGGEKESKTTDFLMSKPLSRIKIFTNKLVVFAGITVAIGLLVTITMVGMKNAGFSVFEIALFYKDGSIALLWEFLLLIFATAIFFGTFSKDTLNALLSAIFGDVLLSYLLLTGKYLKEERTHFYSWEESKYFERIVDILSNNATYTFSAVLFLLALYTFANKKAEGLKDKSIAGIILFLLAALFLAVMPKSPEIAEKAFYITLDIYGWIILCLFLVATVLIFLLKVLAGKRKESLKSKKYLLVITITLVFSAVSIDYVDTNIKKMKVQEYERIAQNKGYKLSEEEFCEKYYHFPFEKTRRELNFSEKAITAYQCHIKGNVKIFDRKELQKDPDLKAEFTNPYKFKINGVEVLLVANRYIDKTAPHDGKSNIGKIGEKIYGNCEYALAGQKIKEKEETKIEKLLIDNDCPRELVQMYLASRSDEIKFFDYFAALDKIDASELKKIKSKITAYNLGIFTNAFETFIVKMKYDGSFKADSGYEKMLNACMKYIYNACDYSEKMETLDLNSNSTWMVLDLLVKINSAGCRIMGPVKENPKKYLLLLEKTNEKLSGKYYEAIKNNYLRENMLKQKDYDKYFTATRLKSEYGEYIGKKALLTERAVDYKNFLETMELMEAKKSGKNNYVMLHVANLIFQASYPLWIAEQNCGNRTNKEYINWLKKKIKLKIQITEADLILVGGK